MNDYRQHLKAVGPASLLQSCRHPVLIVTGMAGTLTNTINTSGTAVAQVSDLVQMTQLFGRVFHLVKSRYAAPGPVSIGRTSESDVVIPEYSISRQHCFIAIVGGQARLTDCGSTNGTLVNGARVDPKRPLVLAGGEVITMGRFALTFHYPRGFLTFLQGS